MKYTLLLPLLLAVSTPVFAAGLELDIAIPQLDVAEYHRPYVAVWIEREDSSVAANLAVWYQQERAKPRPQGARKPRAEGDAQAPGDGKGGPGSGKGPGGGGESGTKWLPDLRQWWRRSGRSLTLPVDGVTGATRPVGTHTLAFDATSAPLKSLAPGNYRIVVEAAREVGGRELLKLPFAWPPIAGASSSAQGKSELGRITLDLTP
jgi:hypothetical protein